MGRALENSAGKGRARGGQWIAWAEQQHEKRAPWEAMVQCCHCCSVYSYLLFAVLLLLQLPVLTAQRSARVDASALPCLAWLCCPASRLFAVGYAQQASAVLCLSLCLTED